MNQDPLGPCHHTHYAGGPHCVHTAYHQGSEDTLAKCIAAVEALPTTIQIPVAHPHEGCPDPTVHMRWTPFLAVPDILAAMRALSANADSDRNVSERRQEKS